MILESAYMVMNAYYETIFKSLQDMRSVKPVVMVLTTKNRTHIIDSMVNAIGFKAIFPDLTPDMIKMLKASSHAVVIDVAAFITQKDTKILDILGKNFITQYGVVNLCDDILLYQSQYLTPLKNILKYNPPLCVSGYGCPFDSISKIVQKSNQSLLGFKVSKKPSLLNLSPTEDIVYHQNTNHIKIIGLDNINHVLNCMPILYSVLAAALMCVHRDAYICGLASAVLLRAASRRAISVTNGPGSYLPVFIDSLFHLKRDYIYPIHLEGNVYTSNQADNFDFMKQSA